MLSLQKAGLRANSQLLPIETCREILDAVDTPAAMAASESVAAQAANFLLQSYPGRAQAQSDVFIKQLSKIFTKYPSNLAQTAIQELVEGSGYLPAVADVKAILERLSADKGILVASSNWMIREHARREEERKDRERWASKGTPEDLARRKAFVERALCRKLEVPPPEDDGPL